MTNKLFIGIDFSYNSLGATFIYNNTVNHLCVYNKSQISDDEISDDEIFKKYEVINSTRPYCEIIMHHRNQVPQVKDIGLATWERIHIAQTILYKKLVFDSIKNFIDTNYDDVNINDIYIAFEHYSFSKDTNVSQQMAEFTAPVKQDVINLIIGLSNLEHFYVISPSVVKKVAGNGGFDKYDMFEAYINECVNCDFQKTLIKNKNLYYKPRVRKGKPFNEMLAPIPDIIDSYYVCKAMIKEVNRQLNS